MRNYSNIWVKLVFLLFAVVVSSPIISHFLSWSSIDYSLWQHLINTFLPEAVINTLKLMICVTSLCLILGSSLAYICTRINFFGVKFFSFFLLAPLCFSKFVMGFSYLSFCEHGGPLQNFSRFLGYDNSYFFAHNNFLILVLVLSLSLYPYVFLATVTALHQENKDELEAAASLGASFFTQFRTVTLPHLRPYLVASSLLVALEVYGDFGASSILGVDTVSTSIFKVWSSFFSLKTASQMATLAIVVVFFLYIFETRVSHSVVNASLFKSIKKIKITKNTNILLFAFCSFVFLVAFILPFVWMLFMFSNSLKEHVFDVFSVFNSSVFIALIATSLVMLLSCVICFINRYQAKNSSLFLQHLMRFGYAVPGTVLAIGVITVVSWFSSKLNNSFFNLLVSSLSCVVFGLTVRFFIIGYNYLKCSFSKLSIDLDHAARLCGASSRSLFSNIHLPLISKGFFAGSLLVFIDSLKEMPITLMTRPIGWDTLAVKVFEYTSESEWEMAVYPSLILSSLAFFALIFTHHFLKDSFSKPL